MLHWAYILVNHFANQDFMLNNKRIKHYSYRPISSKAEVLASLSPDHF